jgi:hypothetical protein
MSEQKQTQAKSQPEPVKAQAAEKPKKIGEGMVAEMVTRGRTELAVGFSMQGHEVGHGIHGPSISR